MKVEISNGELVDKVTILTLKMKYVLDEQKRININNELLALIPPMYKIGISHTDESFIDLLNVNEDLWKIEDR